MLDRNSDSQDHIEDGHGSNAPISPTAKPIGVISIAIRSNPRLAERNVISGNGSASASNARRAAGTSQARQFARIMEGANEANMDPSTMRRPPRSSGSKEEDDIACAIK